MAYNSASFGCVCMCCVYVSVCVCVCVCVLLFLWVDFCWLVSHFYGLLYLLFFVGLFFFSSIDSLLNYIKTDLFSYYGPENLDMLVFAGDVAAHDIWNQSQSKNLQVFQDITNRIESVLPGFGTFFFCLLRKMYFVFCFGFIVVSFICVCDKNKKNKTQNLTN